jgi:CRISPR associated protein Cas1
MPGKKSVKDPFNFAGNRNASHPVNAILNYAYAVLQSQIQIGAVAKGYDPTVGRPCGKSGLSTIAAGEARISSNFCHLSSTLALELA